jgi:hypothetical protein
MARLRATWVTQTPVDNGGVGGDAEEVNPSGAEFDHEQDVEAL